MRQWLWRMRTSVQARIGERMKLSTLRKYALSLPETTEAPHFEYASFRVQGKIFVTVPPDEAFVHVFAPESSREPALAVHSDFIEKLLWGGKVVGVRITLASATPAVVNDLVLAAWRHKAPKRLHFE
jgi:hypothetical protein